MISVLLALGLQSTQAMPLATYDEHLARTERRKLDNAIEASCRFSATQRAMICDERLSRAVTAAETFDARVLPDAELRYLMGLAKRYLGEPTARSCLSRRWRSNLSMWRHPTTLASCY